VLESVRKELEKEVAVCSQLQLGLAHRTIRWCTGQCPVRQTGPCEKAALGTRRRRTTMIHRTVRWCTGLSGEPTVAYANGQPHNLRVTQSSRDSWSRQRSVGHTGLSGVHQTVSGAPTDTEDQWSDAPEMEGDRAPDSYRDYPVVHRTIRCTTRQKESLAFQVGLQRLLAAFGVIKGTPRRMEESPKHSLSILRYPDSAPAHSLCCFRDLSSIRVKDSLCCYLSSSLHLCAWVCCVFESCVCCFSQPYSVPSL
jgi:hypothetical protein